MGSQEKKSNTQTDAAESQLQESKASSTESGKASGPTFVPLQVNRAGMRANKSSADATLKVKIVSMAFVYRINEIPLLLLWNYLSVL